MIAKIQLARAYRPQLLARMAIKGAKSLSDEEMQRCFSDVVAPSKCVLWASLLRDSGEIAYSDIEASR